MTLLQFFNCHCFLIYLDLCLCHSLYVNRKLYNRCFLVTMVFWSPSISMTWKKYYVDQNSEETRILHKRWFLVTMVFWSPSISMTWKKPILGIHWVSVNSQKKMGNQKPTGDTQRGDTQGDVVRESATTQHTTRYISLDVVSESMAK